MFESDIKHQNLALSDKLNALYRLNTGGNRMEMGFRPQYLSLLDKFGNPQNQLPPTIHVAGTNGKGSTIAYLRSMLEAQGKAVHTYTSPHLMSFNERIMLRGQPINDDALESLIDEALEYNNGQSSSFFEITTAMALAAYARTPADILLLETGLGGRLDCTNVISNPIATIITSIGYDHQDFLGHTIQDIATEKAGIMKKSAPCIIAHQPHEQALSALKKAANANDTQTYICGDHWRSQPINETDHDTINFYFGNDQFLCQNIGIKGKHQIHNAGAALAALHVIDKKMPVSCRAKQTGLQSAFWPARMQNITSDIAGDINKNWEIFLDGGHNLDAANAITDQITIWQRADKKPIHLIIGMMAHKSIQDFITPLSSYAQSITAIPIPGEPSASSPEKIIDHVTGQANTDVSYQNAISDIMQTNEHGRIIICGSLYLAGHILQSLKTLP